MNFFKILLRTIGTILLVLIKFLLFMTVMIGCAYVLSPMGTINSKSIDMAMFNNPPNDTLMLLLNSEYFSGYLFAVTIAVTTFVVYLYWQLHEVAVHKAKEKKSTHIQLIFALSLCGLFIHKAWWVLAIIIAFVNWEHIGASISRVIQHGIKTEKEHVKTNLVKKSAPKGGL